MTSQRPNTIIQNHPSRRNSSRLFFLSITAALLGAGLAQAAESPLKVFILDGQSNMVGHGKAEEGLDPKYDPKGLKGTTPLLDGDGKWLIREDVKFKDNVAVVDTRPMWRDQSISPSNFGFHWNHNGPTHYEMGAGMGEAMLKLMKRK